MTDDIAHRIAQLETELAGFRLGFWSGRPAICGICGGTANTEPPIGSGSKTTKAHGFLVTASGEPVCDRCDEDAPYWLGTAAHNVSMLVQAIAHVLSHHPETRRPVLLEYLHRAVDNAQEWDRRMDELYEDD